MISLDPSQRNDIVIRQNQDLPFAFLLTDNAGDDFVVTGYTFNWQVYDRRGILVFDLTDGDGLTVQDGRVDVLITAANLDIPDGDYKHFLWVINPSNQSAVWVNGYAKVKDSLSIGSQDGVAVTVSNADNNVNLSISIAGSGVSVTDQTKIDNLPSDTNAELAAKADKATNRAYSSTFNADKNYLSLDSNAGTQSGATELTLDDTNAVNGYYDTKELLSDGNDLTFSVRPLSIINTSTATVSNETITPVNGDRYLITAWYVTAGWIIIVNDYTLTTADVTAPTFSSGPTAQNILHTSFEIAATLNENGTVYAVSLANGAAAPTSAEVKAGTGSGGGAAIQALSAADSGAGVTLTFNTGLAQGTAYDVYVVAEDDEATPNPQATPTKVDVTTDALPTIQSATMAADNTYIDVVFSEGVYGANDGSTPAALADFTLQFAANGGTATNWTASSAKQNDNTVEGSASALAGGETTIRIFGSETGTPDGAETVTVSPADGASVYDVNGGAMDAGQSAQDNLNAVAGSIILVQDNFNDNSINATIWDQSTDPNVVIAETGQQLEIYSTAASATQKGLILKNAQSSANDVIIVQAKVTQPATGKISIVFGISASPFDANELCLIGRDANTFGAYRCIVKDGGVNEIDVNTGIASGKDVRIIYVPSTGAVTFEYWNGSAWTEFSSTAGNIDLGSSILAFLYIGGTIEDSSATKVLYDDFFVSNDNYSTQYPT